MLEPVNLAGVEGVVEQDGVGAPVGVGQHAAEGLQGRSGGVRKVEDRRCQERIIFIKNYAYIIIIIIIMHPKGGGIKEPTHLPQ